MVNLWKDEKGKDIKDWKKQPADTTTEEFAKELIEVEVTVLGVYDSVSALLPDKDAFVFAEPLNEKILHAYHAIALTERRTKFFPVMWDFAPAGMLTSDPPKLIQCWFMGTHSAVGGSHGQEGVKIDDLTLLWMLGRIDGLAGIDEAQVKKFFLNEKTGQTVKGIEDSKVEGLKLLNAAVHMNFGGIVTSIGKEHLRDQELGFGVGETIHISVHLFRKYTEIKDQGTVFTKLFAQTPPQPTQGGAVAKTKKIGNKNIEADDDDPDEAKSDAGSEDSLPSGPEDEDEEPEGTGRFTWELNATRGQPTQLGTEGKTLTKAKSIPEDDPSPYEAARLETTSTEKPVFDLRRGEDGQRKGKLPVHISCTSLYCSHTILKKNVLTLHKQTRISKTANRAPQARIRRTYKMRVEAVSQARQESRKKTLKRQRRRRKRQRHPKILLMVQQGESQREKQRGHLLPLRHRQIVELRAPTRGQRIVGRSNLTQALKPVVLRTVVLKKVNLSLLIQVLKPVVPQIAVPKRVILRTVGPKMLPQRNGRHVADFVYGEEGVRRIYKRSWFRSNLF
jgi:hypothetical protein